MTKHLFTLLLLFCAATASAQKIYFSDTTNHWNLSRTYYAGEQFPICTISESYAGEDTTIYGNSYQMFTSTSGDKAWIREDTLAQKVFTRIISNVYVQADTTEHVLYDYTLQAGDSFRMYHNDSLMFVHIVDSTAMVSIGGVMHKKISFSAPVNIDQPHPYRAYTVIEGIGCTESALLPYYPFLFEDVRKLYCFTNAGNTPLISPAQGTVAFIFYGNAQQPWLYTSVNFDNVNSCGTLSVPDQIISEEKVPMIFPNPATSKLSILNVDLPFTFTILSVNGQVIQEGRSDNAQIDLTPMPKGVYMLRLTEKNGSYALPLMID